MSFERFCLSVTNSLGRLVISRPEARNALSRRMWEQLPQALADLAGQGAKVIVLSGEGRCFAAGADLGELSRLSGEREARAYWQAISSCLDSVWTFPLPTIAMINGPCLGGGCLLALACDLRYAGSDATFSLPVARLGIVLDDANVVRLVEAVGSAPARELIFRGHTVEAGEAAALGLVNAVVEAADLESYVTAAAGEIIANAQISVSYAKRSVQQALLALANKCIADEEAVVGSYTAPEFRWRVKSLADSQ